MRLVKIEKNLPGGQGVGGSNPLTQILFPKGIMKKLTVFISPFFPSYGRYMTGNVQIHEKIQNNFSMLKKML